MPVRREIRGAPVKRRLIIRGRSADRQRGESLHQLVSRDLGVTGTMAAPSERSDGVNTIGRIEVATRSYCVLGTVWRCAVAARQRIGLELVVAHNLAHGVKIVDSRFVTAEDLSPRAHIMREPAAVLLHQRGVPTHVEDVGEVRDVIRAPITVALQVGGYVADLSGTRNLLQNVKHARGEGLTADKHQRSCTKSAQRSCDQLSGAVR